MAGEDMNQTERRQYLIKRLLSEQPRYEDIAVPEDSNRKNCWMNTQGSAVRVMAKESITSGKPMARAR